MNYYERHIGDYLKDTAHLSLIEHGVYTRLLDVYYTREHGFQEGEAHRLIGARSRDERAAVDTVLAEFFVNTSGGMWLQERCDREIARYQAKVERNREVGKLGGRPRKTETQTKPDGLSVGSESEPKQNPLQTPDTSLQTPDTKVKSIARGSRLPENFEPDASAANEQGIDFQLESAKFRDYWIAQPGQKGVKTDWPATWRNWCRNAKSSVRIGANGSRQTALEARNRAVIDEYLRETQ